MTQEMPNRPTSGCMGDVPYAGPDDRQIAAARDRSPLPPVAPLECLSR